MTNFISQIDLVWLNTGCHKLNPYTLQSTEWNCFIDSCNLTIMCPLKIYDDNAKYAYV